mmetsp:Transcript_18211/g.47875  ORF Transcript_18211/g.47875 Transcript_18211/m.47875 type:complete len:283 (-) Transcript_18211:1235-2083(-)
MAMCDHPAREPVHVQTDGCRTTASWKDDVMPIAGHVVGVIPHLDDLVRIYVQVEWVEADTGQEPFLDLADLDVRQRPRIVMSPHLTLPIEVDLHGIEQRQVHPMPVFHRHLHLAQVCQVARAPHRKALQIAAALGLEIWPREGLLLRRRRYLDAQQLASRLLHCHGSSAHTHRLPFGLEVQVCVAGPREETACARHRNISPTPRDQIDALDRSRSLVQIDAILGQELILAVRGALLVASWEDLDSLLDRSEHEAEAIPLALLERDLRTPLPVHHQFRVQAEA